MIGDNQMSENRYLDEVYGDGPDDYDHVAPGFACPKCGEDCNDLLTNGPDETITCQSCGHVYDLEPERREAPHA